MLIDYLTGRRFFSQSDVVISIVLYALAGVAALLLRRWGQVRNGKPGSGFWKTLRRDLPSGIWEILFFLFTGCLKGPLGKEDKAEDKSINRKIFFGGIRYTFFGVVGSFLLLILLQILKAALGGTAWEIPFLWAKALTGANLSLLWFSLLPLPDSDAETFLRTKPLGEKEKAFRENGTWAFFFYCALGLLLACIPIPLGNGTVASLSGILTLFPIHLIGG